MSNEATPISPARFALALRDLPLSTLHLKAAELRNSIAHLDYSNEQLKPFAEGTEGAGGPDQDCVDAIRENEVVIARMGERVRLLREEVEGRGSSWLEFQSAEEVTEEGEKAEMDGRGEAVDRPAVNGTGMGHVEGEMGTGGARGEERSQAWSDGTFQTGRIVNGEVRMDGAAAANGVNGTSSTNGTDGTTGGRLDDEALRRAVEERMGALSAEDNDDDEGMHL